ncbi:DUF2927 domain-containing protein [Neotabrizicola sp. sgz301269]|uniref:DUF2927 domain-containing protein n=1 Tax=Neotabrizicola sp. sgz301269 TaxID=3276282 RepID=UPI00376F9CE1
MRRLALLLALLAQPAPAQDVDFDAIATSGLLADQEFFALATCGAPPGGACRGPTVRWAKTALTVALLPSDASLSADLSRLLDRSLDQAIAQINGAGADLTLTRGTGPGADIRLYISAAQPGDAMRAEPGLTAPGTMGVGYSTIWWNGRNEITAATILISTAMEAHDMQSVVLEELFQALGPRFDVQGRAYEGVSILSQDSNATTVIEGQDAALLRWLYP